MNNYKKLINAAKKAKENSYSPYSNFKVGAAVLSKSGKIYLGTNYENASFSATVCAERNALGAAIANGERAFKAIAICGDKKAFPCGICLQSLIEFGEMDVIIVSEEPEIYKLSSLLPNAFKEF